MAVYTEIPDEDLSHFVAEYDIGGIIFCKGIAEGVENSNFLLQTDRKAFILTIYEKRVKIDDLPFFLDLMEYLALAGVSCPIPLRGRDGCALRTLCGRPAAVVTFLAGICPKRVTPMHCLSLGEALARLHIAGRNYPKVRQNTLSVRHLRPLFEVEAQRANSVLPGLADEIRHELDYLEKWWPVALPSGIIHADLFPDNVFFHNERVSGVIDFYFACNDFLAYDIAVCLNAWCFEPDGTFNVTKGRWLVSAYNRVRPLNEIEISTLPILARGAAMRFLLTRLYDWLNKPKGAFVKPKNPLEYVRKMYFHRNTTNPKSYGVVTL